MSKLSKQEQAAIAMQRKHPRFVREAERWEARNRRNAKKAKRRDQ